MKPSHSTAILRKHLLDYKYLTELEVEEIFGTDEVEFQEAIHVEEWKEDLLDSGKILLYDEGIAKRFKGVFGSPNPIELSIPAIRADGEFALIQMRDRTLGGLLHIYKKTNGEWVMYKQIRLSHV